MYTCRLSSAPSYVLKEIGVPFFSWSADSAVCVVESDGLLLLRGRHGRSAAGYTSGVSPQGVVPSPAPPPLPSPLFSLRFSVRVLLQLGYGAMCGSISEPLPALFFY